MQSKKYLLFVILGLFCFSSVHAEDVVAQEDLENLSADAVEEYDETGSMFQQITTLEQEKVLMQLEKERAQLDLDLDRLAAEKIKLSMEIDTLSGRSEQQQKELDVERARLEAEEEKIQRERENLANQSVADTNTKTVAQKQAKATPENGIADSYKLVNVLGAGSQLQATLEDLSTGQNKRVSVGKTIAGFTVKSISLDEGVVFEKDGETQMLNISNR